MNQSHQPNHTSEMTANHLIKETSPYLLQHAYNPVRWHAWGTEPLKKAKEEDKPILISIGYSTCHWCHVMEKESFENEEIAQLMNEKFICIKIDREERPDIDQIYMEAVQMMGLQGGWPLNVFLTPDKIPFYGGTYFPPQRWVSVLSQLSDAYQNKKEEVLESSQKFIRSLQVSEAAKYGLKAQGINSSQDDLKKIYPLLEKRFDTIEGGMDKEPKFPMPSIYRYLLSDYHLTGNQKALDHVVLTLTKVAQGGIYDQIGGGFARYSTDKEWLAPHFEKMLYDNGQLVSLYSEAYQITKKSLFKETVYESLEFIKREMTNKEGGFYSALDADSEGEEGRFYIWDYTELEHIISSDFALFADFFDVSPAGNWEGTNILRVQQGISTFCSQKQIDENDFKLKLKKWKEEVLTERAKRIRPGLDDKSITSWNALMLKGYIDAYRAFGEDDFLKVAIRNAGFIENKLTKNNQLLRTYKNGRAKVAAFLEDYATVIDAYIHLYQVTFEEKWLIRAKELTDIAIENFYDEKEKLFFYSGKLNEDLIVDKKELFDNVIPASNSIMATNLYFLGIFYDNAEYSQKAESMISVVHPLLFKEPSYMANWASLYSYYLFPTAEIIVSGESSSFQNDLSKNYLTNSLLIKATKGSQIPLTEGKHGLKSPTIFVCYDKTCQLPVHSVSEALNQIK